MDARGSARIPENLSHQMDGSPFFKHKERIPLNNNKMRVFCTKISKVCVIRTWEVEADVLKSYFSLDRRHQALSAPFLPLPTRSGHVRQLTRKICWPSPQPWPSPTARRWGCTAIWKSLASQVARIIPTRRRSSSTLPVQVSTWMRVLPAVFGYQYARTFSCQLEQNGL